MLPISEYRELPEGHFSKFEHLVNIHSLTPLGEVILLFLPNITWWWHLCTWRRENHKTLGVSFSTYLFHVADSGSAVLLPFQWAAVRGWHSPTWLLAQWISSFIVSFFLAQKIDVDSFPNRMPLFTNYIFESRIYP